MVDPIRGINGATPIETMRAFRKEMIEMVTFLILDNVPKRKLAALDALAIRFHKSHRQTICRTFPATDFSQGITTLSKISAAERLGTRHLQFLHKCFTKCHGNKVFLQQCLLIIIHPTLPFFVQCDCCTNKLFCHLASSFSRRFFLSCFLTFVTSNIGFQATFDGIGGMLSFWLLGIICSKRVSSFFNCSSDNSSIPSLFRLFKIVTSFSLMTFAIAL